MTCALLLCFGLSVASAAVEVNQASGDDLESIKGIGPSTAQRILHQRRAAPFRDWHDLILRVPGIGDKRAARLSDQGLRVQGQAFRAVDARPAANTTRPIGYAPRSPAPPAPALRDR
ncbi:MAG: helix-hairpin-helix domain-containing protein [Hydrogenophaga sp.]|nr:helix-hairpin-helix domain-containing protein [Hydrogenophaga sp.]